MTDHKVIWLEPVAALNPNYDRTWCQDNVWGDDGVKYVRADLLEAAEIERDACKETMIEQSAEAYRLLKDLIAAYREYGDNYRPVSGNDCADELQAILEAK